MDDDVLHGTPWRAISKLGEGSQATVFRAEHAELGTVRAVKVLVGAVDEVSSARMQTEWRTLVALRHPNIVEVIDAGFTSDGRPYFAMELLRGETLQERLAHAGKLNVDVAATIARHVLSGLDSAHAHNIVHRDLKPSNIFLCIDGTAKVIDFGVALTSSSGELTRDGMVIGSPRYMSPEQVEGRTLDARSDLYAVGAILFEMLSGKPPFDDAAESGQQMRAHAWRAAPRLRDHADVPRALDDLVRLTMCKSPDDRPATAERFSALLNDAIIGEPPGHRRHRPKLAVAALIGSVLGFIAATQTPYGPKERFAPEPATCPPAVTAAAVAPLPECPVPLCPAPSAVVAASPAPRLALRRSKATVAATAPVASASAAPVASVRRPRSIAEETVDTLPEIRF